MNLARHRLRPPQQRLPDTPSPERARDDHPGQVEEVTVRREVEKSGHVRHERLPRTLGSTRGEEREVARSDERRAVLAVIRHEAQKITAAPPHLRGNRTTEVSQGRVRVGRGRVNARIGRDEEKARQRTFCTSPLRRSLLVLPLLLKPSASRSATSLSWSRSSLPSPYTCRTLHCVGPSSPLSSMGLSDPSCARVDVDSRSLCRGDVGATRRHPTLRRTHGTRAKSCLNATDHARALPDAAMRPRATCCAGG